MSSSPNAINPNDSSMGNKKTQMLVFFFFGGWVKTNTILFFHQVNSKQSFAEDINW